MYSNIDPLYLSWIAKKIILIQNLLSLHQKQIFKQLQWTIKQINKVIKSKKIGEYILGIAYKKYRGHKESSGIKIFQKVRKIR